MCFPWIDGAVVFDRVPLGPGKLICWKSCPAFSSMFMRWMRSSTRSSTDREASRYGAESISVDRDVIRGYFAPLEVGTRMAVDMAVAAKNSVVKVFSLR